MFDMNAFAQEWQVTDAEPKLFMTDRDPQYPTKCILPTAEMKKERRIGGLHWMDVAYVACQKVTGYKHNDCTKEVKATRDVSVVNKYL